MIYEFNEPVKGVLWIPGKILQNIVRIHQFFVCCYLGVGCRSVLLEGSDPEPTPGIMVLLEVTMVASPWIIFHPFLDVDSYGILMDISKYC